MRPYPRLAIVRILMASSKQQWSRLRERQLKKKKKKEKNPFVYFLIFKPLLPQLLVLHAWFECRGKQHEEQEDYHFIVEKFVVVCCLVFFQWSQSQTPESLKHPFPFLLFTTEKLGNSRIEWMKVPFFPSNGSCSVFSRVAQIIFHPVGMEFPPKNIIVLKALKTLRIEKKKKLWGGGIRFTRVGVSCNNNYRNYNDKNVQLICQCVCV